MNFLEKTIAYISPTWALQRESARTELARAFAGAKVSKTRPNWRRVEEDADAAILADLPSLRARCNELAENNEVVAGIVEEFCKNVVGIGIKPQLTDSTAKEHETLIRKTLQNPLFIDNNGIDDFYDLQMLVLRHWLIDGEAFIRICGKGRLEVIDPGRIWSDKQSNGRESEIRSGIEIDASGKHVAYWIGPHPGAYRQQNYSFTRIPAKDMIHVYLRKKASQTRGYPVFSPILEKLHDLDEMSRAALISARIAACVGLIIQRQRHGTPGQNDDGDNIDNIYPGMIKRLRAGETVYSLEPKQPGEQFDPFTAYNHRGIATGVGIAYETVSRDMSRGNFSSARLSKISENATYRIWQNWLIKKFCRPAFNVIQEYRFLKGLQPDVFEVRWQTPGFAWVDPEKDVAANILAVNNNLKTKSAVVAEMGGDLDEILEGRALEVAREKEIGVENDGETNKSGLSDSGKIIPANV